MADITDLVQCPHCNTSYVWDETVDLLKDPITGLYTSLTEVERAYPLEVHVCQCRTIIAIGATSETGDHFLYTVKR